MGYPRRLLVDDDIAGFYHCVSRCVRKAFLCGDRYEHRRSWIEDRLAQLVEIFAIQPCGYGIMSNHLHVVLKTDPQQAAAWTDRQVVERWLRLYPKRLEKVTLPAGSKAAAKRAREQLIQNLLSQESFVATWRKRLASISWFNKLLKEPIARRANREDGCTGHFWEGRFKSHRLLDEAAVLACMVYVDLNPIRAGIAKALGECGFTSLIQRLKAIKADSARRRRTSRRSGKGRRARRPGGWVIPIESLFSMTTGDYVSLVAHTGGVGQDEGDHAQRLSALGVDPARWSKLLSRTARMYGTAIGCAAELVTEARRRGCRWIVNALDVYRR